MAITEVWVSEAMQEHFRRVGSVEPVMKREDDEETGEQQVDTATGYPVWQIAVGIQLPGRRIDWVHVKVPAPSEPDVNDKYVVFGNLRAKSWAMLDRFRGTANGGLSWKADTVASVDDMPSSKRAAASATNGEQPAPPAPTTARAEAKGGGKG